MHTCTDSSSDLTLSCASCVEAYTASQCGDDLFVWPDGSYCYRCEHEDAFSGKSDDFEVVRFGTPAYDQLSEELNA